MGLDMFVWHEAEPISADEARAKLDRWAESEPGVFTATPALQRFRDALRQRFKRVEFLDEGDGILAVSCGWLIAADVTDAAVALATEHGLVCYEPASEVLNPNAPGYVAEFVLTGAGIPTIPDPDPQRLDWAVRRLDDRHYFAILDHADGRYAQIGYGEQAGVKPGTWALEYHDDGLFRTETTDIADAVRFFRDYVSGGNGWRNRHVWHTVPLDA